MDNTLLFLGSSLTNNVSDVVQAVILLLFVAAGITFYIWIVRTKNKSDEEIKKNMQELQFRYHCPDNYSDNAVFCYGESEVFRGGKLYGVWKSNNTINFLNCITVGGNNHSYVEIPVSSIKAYKLEGESHYVSNVSGGGGGGRSIGGAIIGGAIAGPVGAIVGGRKKNKEIKTETIHIDNRKTLLYFVADNKEQCESFNGTTLYEFLLKKCPEKEFAVAANQTHKAERDIKDSDMMAKRMKELKNLYDLNLISQEEYDKKRSEIISEI